MKVIRLVDEHGKEIIASVTTSGKYIIVERWPYRLYFTIESVSASVANIKELIEDAGRTA